MASNLVTGSYEAYNGTVCIGTLDNSLGSFLKDTLMAGLEQCKYTGLHFSLPDLISIYLYPSKCFGDLFLKCPKDAQVS